MTPQPNGKHCLACGEALFGKRRVRCGRVRCEKYQQGEPVPKRLHLLGTFGPVCGRAVPRERLTEDVAQVDCLTCLSKLALRAGVDVKQLG
jgi:hypothetical protein